jgi:hypothetical protein
VSISSSFVYASGLRRISLIFCRSQVDARVMSAASEAVLLAAPEKYAL